MLCVFTEVLLRAHAKGRRSLNDFKFGTSVGCFLSDGAAGMAVKGLILQSFLAKLAMVSKREREKKKKKKVGGVRRVNSVAVGLFHIALFSAV